MAYNIGINVIETEGKAPPAIAGAPTSVAGFILRSRRGPTDKAVRVSSFRQFKERFGGYIKDSVGAYCVDGFFLNGGQEAYITRVLGKNSAAASVNLKDRTGTDTLKITAGYRGTPDQGVWGNSLFVDIQDNPEFSTKLVATLSGNQPARLQGEEIDSADLRVAEGSSARALSLKVDGSSSAITITFDDTTLPDLAAVTAQDVVRLINVRAGSQVVAAVESGGILIVSRTKGESSQINVDGTADDTLTPLGFDPDAAEATGTNIANNQTYNEAQVDSIAGLKVGDWVRLDDNITQNWHEITELVEQDDDGTGNPQYLIRWQPPTASECNEYRIEDNAILSTCEFDLVIRHLGPNDTEPQIVETWEKLTLDSDQPNYAPLKLNDPFSGSTYVTLADLNPGTFNGRDVPALGKDIRLGQATPTTQGLTRVKGSDGSPSATKDYCSALPRFDTIAIQLLAIPELMGDGVLKATSKAALEYCANDKGDCLFVGHAPPSRNAAGAKAFGQEFRGSKVYGALYWPWITVTDPIGSGPNPIKKIPPTGHVMGTYARIDQTRGIWKAPAGNEATLRGALAVEQEITDRDHTDLVKNGSVNGIRMIRGAGIVIDASRTLSTDTRWLYVNVRLLFNYVKTSLREGLRWVKQEPNRERLWNTVKYNTVTPFLQRLYQAGAFGPGSPEDVFTVVCGPENNPSDQIQLGNLTVEIYFYPARPAETIIIIVGQQESGATAREQ